MRSHSETHSGPKYPAGLGHARNENLTLLSRDRRFPTRSRAIAPCCEVEIGRLSERIAGTLSRYHQSKRTKDSFATYRCDQLTGDPLGGAIRAAHRGIVARSSERPV